MCGRSVFPTGYLLGGGTGKNLRGNQFPEDISGGGRMSTGISILQSFESVVHAPNTRVVLYSNCDTFQQTCSIFRCFFYSFESEFL